MTAVTPRRTVDELRARITQAGPWVVVPAGSKLTRCRSCDSAIYFVRPASGKLTPVDCLVPGGALARSDADGRGVSHFATCPDSPMWKKPRG